MSEAATDVVLIGAGVMSATLGACSFGVNRIEDAAACDRIRAQTAPVLKIANV